MKRLDYTAMTQSQMISECGADAMKWAAAFMQYTAKKGGDFTEHDVFVWFANAIETAFDVKSQQRGADPQCMTGSEAIYGFAGWLTTRKEDLVFGSTHNCGPVADACEQFIKANDLAPPRRHWPSLLKHPENK